MQHLAQRERACDDKARALAADVEAIAERRAADDALTQKRRGELDDAERVSVGVMLAGWCFVDVGCLSLCRPLRHEWWRWSAALLSLK